MVIEVTFNEIAVTGFCTSLNKECEGYVVSFKDGSVTNYFCSPNGLERLLRAKAGKAPKRSRRSKEANETGENK